MSRGNEKTGAHWIRGVLWAVVAGVAIWASTFAGKVTFWWGFQRSMEANAESLQGESGGMDATGFGQPLGQLEPSTWKPWRDERTGYELRLPPGEVRGITYPDVAAADADPQRTPAVVEVELDTGKFRVEPLPPDLVSKLWLEELAQLGCRNAEDSDVSASDVFDAVFSTHVRDYRFSWDARQRGIYAARILTRLLLVPIPGTQRLAWGETPDGRGRVLALTGGDGSGRILWFDADAARVIHVAPGSPAEWLAEPSSWIP